jgi:hypothetical protein
VAVDLAAGGLAAVVARVVNGRRGAALSGGREQEKGGEEAGHYRAASLNALVARPNAEPILSGAVCAN